MVGLSLVADEKFMDNSTDEHEALNEVTARQLRDKFAAWVHRNPNDIIIMKVSGDGKPKFELNITAKNKEAADDLAEAIEQNTPQDIASHAYGKIVSIKGKNYDKHDNKVYENAGLEALLNNNGDLALSPEQLNNIRAAVNRDVSVISLVAVRSVLGAASAIVTPADGMTHLKSNMTYNPREKFWNAADTLSKGLGVRVQPYHQNGRVYLFANMPEIEAPYAVYKIEDALKQHGLKDLTLRAEEDGTVTIASYTINTDPKIIDEDMHKLVSAKDAFAALKTGVSPKTEQHAPAPEAQKHAHSSETPAHSKISAKSAESHNKWDSGEHHPAAAHPHHSHHHAASVPSAGKIAPPPDVEITVEPAAGHHHTAANGHHAYTKPHESAKAAAHATTTTEGHQKDPISAQAGQSATKTVIQGKTEHTAHDDISIPGESFESSLRAHLGAYSIAISNAKMAGVTSRSLKIDDIEKIVANAVKHEKDHPGWGDKEINRVINATRQLAGEHDLLNHDTDRGHLAAQEATAFRESLAIAAKDGFTEQAGKFGDIFDQINAAIKKGGIESVKASAISLPKFAYADTVGILPPKATAIDGKNKSDDKTPH